MGKFLTGSPVFARVIPGDPDYDRAVKARRPHRVERTIMYRSDRVLSGEVIVIPEEHRYLTDFASIPWLFRRHLPQDGPWTGAAVVHDWLCDTQPPDIDSRAAADIFHEAMEDLRVAALQRTAMHAAVRWFGPRWKNRVAERGSDPPKGGTTHPTGFPHRRNGE